MPADHSTDHLKGRAKKIADAIVVAARKILDREPCTGGCTTFYSKEAWKDRGESYGTESLLVVVHDGGDFADIFGTYGPTPYQEAMNAALDKMGLWHEPCTCWYTAVYD